MCRVSTERVSRKEHGRLLGVTRQPACAQENDWKLITASQPSTMEMPPLSQCSPWLCMNVLSLSDKVIFCEESEKGMIELFNDQGFDTITLPFRNVFEFGGSFHCVTTDIRRRGHMKSYFKALDAAEAATAKA